MLSYRDVRTLVSQKREELTAELKTIQDNGLCNVTSDKCLILQPSDGASEIENLTNQRYKIYEGLKDDQNSNTSALINNDCVDLNTESSENLECNSKTQNRSPISIARLLRKYSCPNIGMLRAGEYSPNNPELAGDERTARGGDVFLGLGLYEEKRKKLLQKRQIEYREYLAKQSQLNSLKKQSSKRLPPGRNLFLEDDKKEYINDWNMNMNNLDKHRRPSSVGVQTDPEELALMGLERRNNNAFITQAERELSPRPSVHGSNNPADWRMLVEKVNIGTQNNLIVPPSNTGNKSYLENIDKDKTNFPSDFIDPFKNINSNMFRNDSPRARLMQDLRHTYMPSLFDVEAIRQRNIKAEEEAAIKRATYQLDLKKQIEEQQRIREEKKAREKLLEEAETRRLEEQLRMLKLTQDNEIQKQKELAIRIRADSNDFERKRIILQNEIDVQKKNLKNVKSKYTKAPRSDPSSSRNIPVDKRESYSKTSTQNSPLHSSNSFNKEVDPGVLSYNVKRNNPFVGQDISSQRTQFSTNIPEKSIFNRSIPVKNFNTNITPNSTQRFSNEYRSLRRPEYRAGSKNDRPKYEPAFLNKRITDMIDLNVQREVEREDELVDSLPIPVLRVPDRVNKNNLKAGANNSEDQSSEPMKTLEQKWQIPAVQKNILKNNFTEDGKQANILTQLGSIRRQLQLEQLKMDQSQIFSKQNLVK